MVKLKDTRCAVKERVNFGGGASQVIEIEGMKRRLAVLRGEASANDDASPALGSIRERQQ
jgi:hypothetical protein